MKQIVFFRKGNLITYGQDLSMHIGLPSGVTFRFESAGSYWKLTAKGFGDKERYGNGAIYLPKDGFKYLTQRGVRTNTRPYRDISRKEKRLILDDYMTIGSQKTREKWNISSSTLHHVQWHNRDIEEEIEEEHFKRVGL